MDDDQMSELREAFMMFDKDGSETISIDEIEAVLIKLGKKPNPEQLKTMIRKVDDNGDGTIDFEEFCRLMTKKNKVMTFEAELKEAFNVFDADSNGFISAQELMQVLNNIGETVTDEEIDLMINEADLNGDGQMDWDEFVKVMLY